MFNPFFRSYLSGFRVGSMACRASTSTTAACLWRANASFDGHAPDRQRKGLSDAAQPQIPPSISFSLPGAEGWGPIGAADRLARVSRQSAGRRPRLQCWSAG